MIKKNQIAKGVLVTFTSKWVTKCMGDVFLSEEKAVFLRENHVYNDAKGEYVWLEGISGCNSGIAYLDEIEAVDLVKLVKNHIDTHALLDINKNKEPQDLIIAKAYVYLDSGLDLFQSKTQKESQPYFLTN